MRHTVTGLGLVTAALLVSTAPAAAQSPQSRQPARADSTQERTICMRVELSNSRIARRVCRTESEWRARGELDDDMR